LSAAGERFVSEKAVRAAVQGHETNVLDALGIEWRKGRPHISCPYRDHADNKPSWRWDQKKTRAFCTCIEADGHKSHSVFDIVMKVKTITFEDAKIFVAETIGRQDLVRMNGGGGQKPDPASLLAPPAAQSWSKLPMLYVAARLGVGDPDMVIMPATRTAGWRALAYYDPPPATGGKALFVGAYPCAVFETVAADGRIHAHRIYLAADGRAKADLGLNAAGKPRDPKKSARKAPDQPSIAGLSVVWGDPAACAVLAEGIETAAAIAYAFRDEIEHNELRVFSAISGAGIEAFVPWPSTDRIIIAADRDEAKPGAGFKYGERKARRLALRLAEEMKSGDCPKIELATALAGAPGTASDFLDVLLAEGADAVKRIILSAETFTATVDEIEEFAKGKAERDEIARVAAAYPIPQITSLQLAYRPNRFGSVWLHKLVSVKEDKTTGEKTETWLPICTPFRVVEEHRIGAGETDYGIKVELEDRDWISSLTFSRQELWAANSATLVGRLFGAGLRTANNGHFDVVVILREARASNVLFAFARSGWHPADAGERVFVTPGGEAFGPAASARSVLKDAIDARTGTMAGWQDAMRAAIAAEKCPHWRIGIAAGFAGVLVDLLGLENHGLHLCGPSSLGKTTAQALAASVWGSPKLGVGLLQSMRATENAIEFLAIRSHGTVLALDEMAAVTGRVIDRAIYMLATGKGKSRMNAIGGARPTAGWSTYVLTSGEQGLEQKVHEDGGQWSAGMAARFCSVDISGVNGKTPAATMKRLKAIERHYGHGGPVFVQGIIEHGWHRDPDPLRERIARETRRLAGEDADSVRLRAAMPLAVISVAGALVAAFGIVPELGPKLADAVDWAWARFADSREAEVLDSEGRAVDTLGLWIAEHWDVALKRIERPMGQNSRDAVGWYDEEAIYVPSARLAEAAGNGLSPQAVGKVLNKRDLLARSDNEGNTIRRIPGVGLVRAYALRRDAFDDAKNARPAAASKPRKGWFDDC
jgi:hypothetical protein